MAVAIHTRIDQLSAVDSIDILVSNNIGRCHLLKGNRAGKYAMDLIHPFRLLFEQKGDGLHIVQVVSIEDYH